MFVTDTTEDTQIPAKPETKPDTAAIISDTEQKYPFRLLKGESVLGAFPISQKRRPLGKIASFLFVTDSRVLYSAEAKSLTASSTHLKEFQVQTVTGIEVSRHRGLDALATAAGIGAVMNFIIMVIFASILGDSSLGIFLGILSGASLAVGAAAVMVMARSTAEIRIIGPLEAQSIARGGDVARLLIIILLFVIFGPFIGLALITWAALRELGLFKARDAHLYIDTKNVDVISYEAGALILDVQARGTFVGKN